MSPSLKWTVALAVVAGLAGAVWFQIHRLRALRPQVWTEAVTERNVTATVTAVGRARGRQETALSAPDDGRVRAVLVHHGATVRKEQVLILLDDHAERLALERARASGAIAAAAVDCAAADADRLRTRLELARLEDRRAAPLFAAGLEADETVMRRRYEARHAELAHAAALEAVEAARANLRRAEAEVIDAESHVLRQTVRAPGDGVVTEVFVQPWQPVHGGSAHVPPSRLLTLAAADISDVEVALDAADAARLRPGGRASVEIAVLGARNLGGRIVGVGQAGVRVRLDVTPPGLKAGMSAIVRFTTASRARVLAVPNHAVTAGREGGAVSGGAWTVRDGVIALVPIVLGLRGDFYSEVLAGLSPGTMVVTGPGAMIETLGIGDRAVAVPAPIRAP